MVLGALTSTCKETKASFLGRKPLPLTSRRSLLGGTLVAPAPTCPTAARCTPMCPMAFPCDRINSWDRPWLPMFLESSSQSGLTKGLGSNPLALHIR